MGKENEKSGIKNREDLLKRNLSRSKVTNFANRDKDRDIKGTYTNNKSVSNVRNISRTIRNNERDVSGDLNKSKEILF